MNKPLTKEEREDLKELTGLPAFGFPASYGVGLKKALSAEAYWREAVRDSWIAHVSGGEHVCNFCNSLLEPPLGVYSQHNPACPWMLAQEEKNAEKVGA